MKNEKQTRRELIDKRLLDAGWHVGDKAQVIEEFFYQSAPADLSSDVKSNFSDYILLGRDGKPLAVVEAKKTAVDAENGREQAKQYCQQIKEHKNIELPFCFYTNGEDIFFWDIGHYPPRKVIGFPTREDLVRWRNLRASRSDLRTQWINTYIAGRDYQQMAIRAVLESAERKRRNFLLVMATGTGKTRICIALVEAMMRAGWVEKVLFLVDRVALRDQSLDTFKEHLPNEPRWPKLGEKLIAKDRRVYISTYPTMLNIVRDADQPLSPHFFDLVIVDESHRSIYNTYKEVLNYFGAITLGLTATPTDVIDHNTFQLFECEDGLPTFAYTYQEAISHVPPYLCNFQVMKIRTKFQEQGISKRTILLEDQKRLMLEGENIEKYEFDGTELEKSVSNRGTNSLIVKTFMEDCIKDDNGVLPGKTIFFCVSKAHARAMEQIFDSLYPEHHGELAKVIVSDDPRAYGKGGLLHQFIHRDFPRIAISVDMLDTGIDLRELVNLVFAKPVFSYTKFWQMIGRGTRLLEAEKLKPWCKAKDTFLIMDCWDNFEYFKINPQGKELSSQVPLPIRLFDLRLNKMSCSIEQSRLDILIAEAAKIRLQIAGLPEGSVVVRDAQAILAKVSMETFWTVITPEKIGFLRNEIMPLMRSVSGADFKAMRFEKDIVELSLADLGGEQSKFEILRDAIIATVAALPLTVNTVARAERYILEVQRASYWTNMDQEKYDQLIESIGPLLRFVESSSERGGRVQLNFKDILLEKEFIEFGPEQESISISRYKEMVEETVTVLSQSNPVLQKIKAGEHISEQEITQLAEMLYQEHPNITVELLRRVYNQTKAQLQEFIKHILGIEILQSFPQTVAAHFQDFINAHSYLTSRQLQFLDLLKSFIISRGEIHKRNLIESPFTMIHPDGIRGVFDPAEIDEILMMTARLMAA